MASVGNPRLLAPVEDALAEGEVHIKEESGEDVADFKHASSPQQPSADDVERHRVDHLPYRSWCKHCIMGRGVGPAHKTIDAKSQTPIVGIDYFFVTKEGIRRRDELAADLADDSDDAIVKARANGQLVKCLMVKCLETKACFSHVVPQKGDDEDHYCAKLVAADIEWLGHTSVVLKSDNESAVLSLKL